MKLLLYYYLSVRVKYKETETSTAGHTGCQCERAGAFHRAQPTAQGQLWTSEPAPPGPLQAEGDPHFVINSFAYQ